MALIFAYPLLAHSAVASGAPAFAWSAWLCLAALAYLAFPRAWRLAAFAALAAAPFLADANALLKLPPLVINFALAAWFGRSLASGEEPMVSWFARLERSAELPADLARYTRSLTFIWTVFFVAMGVCAATLALLADPQTWSLFTNAMDYLLVVALFVGEYAYRCLRYRHHKHASLVGLVRTVIRSGRLAPRRSARG